MVTVQLLCTTTALVKCISDSLVMHWNCGISIDAIHVM